MLFAVLALSTTLGTARAYEPIYVVFSYHHDPLGGSAQGAQNTYPNHRAALQWATALSLSTGLKISAASTGPYAEACVINNDEADFLSFMPGGHNALGTHLHAHRKLAGFVDYQWQDVGAGEKPPIITAEVLGDQIAYVNQIYTALGFSATDNAYFHGTHVTSPGIMDQFYSGGGIPPNAYPNVFSILGGSRGLYHPYRAGAETDEDLNGAYVKIPVTGGIAGRDELHGPEGMLYGTLPYQKKDFMLEYLEWRYAQSRGLLDRIWVYGWGSHPYQTTVGYLGTDGVPIRQTIEGIVAWLNSSFIEQPSAEGNVIARYATYAEVRDRFVQWEQQHPGEPSMDGDPATGPDHVLTATADRLAASYYEAEIAVGVSVEMHQFVDRDNGTAQYVAWTDSPPQTLDLSSEIAGRVAVIDHAGVVALADSGAIIVGQDPLVILAAAPGDLNLDGAVDTADVPAFVAAMLDPAADPLLAEIADVNVDGTTNAGDVQAFVELLVGP